MSFIKTINRRYHTNSPAKCQSRSTILNISQTLKNGPSVWRSRKNDTNGIRHGKIWFLRKKVFSGERFRIKGSERFRILHELQYGYLSSNPHVEGEPFPLNVFVTSFDISKNLSAHWWGVLEWVSWVTYTHPKHGEMILHHLYRVAQKKRSQLCAGIFKKSFEIRRWNFVGALSIQFRACVVNFIIIC